MRRPARVALIATADVGNFGDMLFPDLAEHALARRLGDVDVTVYGFRRMGGDDWPRSVQPLSELPERLADTDVLVIGGGDLIRFEPPLAPGYGPTEPGVHNPTGLWLVPTLLAAANGVPVVWSALGANGDPPPWIRLPGRAAVESVALAAVRDGASAETLRRLSPAAAPRIVPDTAFGVAELIPAEETAMMRDLRAAAGLDGPYAILQAAPQMRAFAGDVRAFADAARERGLTVLELPISPALGDAAGVAPDAGPVVRLPSWPPPIAVAELIARSEAVAAQSLHMSIVAVASGVPVHRPAPAAGEKYEQIMGLPGVHAWGADNSGVTLGRGAPSVAARELAAQASGYWDDVAALVRAGRRPVPAGLDALLVGLPFELEALRAAAEDGARLRERATEADELERRRDELEEYARGLERTIVRLQAVEAELRRRLPLRVLRWLRSAVSRRGS